MEMSGRDGQGGQRGGGGGGRQDSNNVNNNTQLTEQSIMGQRPETNTSNVNKNIVGQISEQSSILGPIPEGSILGARPGLAILNVINRSQVKIL